MTQVIASQFDAFLTWAGIMFLIYAFFWCRRALLGLRYSLRFPRSSDGAAGFFERLESWRSPISVEGRCWAMIAAATVSLWTAAAWTG